MEKKELEVLLSIKEKYRYNETISAYDQPSLPPFKTITKGDRPCAVCGVDNTLSVGLTSGGSNAGCYIVTEFQCNVCKNYSVYERECSPREIE